MLADLMRVGKFKKNCSIKLFIAFRRYKSTEDLSTLHFRHQNIVYLWPNIILRLLIIVVVVALCG